MIYLSKQPHLDHSFFLRVVKEMDQEAFELDSNKSPQFVAGKGGVLPNGKQMDLLEVWVVPLEGMYPSVVYSEKPLISQHHHISEKVKIRIIDSKSNEIKDQTEFNYKDAFLENYLEFKVKT